MQRLLVLRQRSFAAFFAFLAAFSAFFAARSAFLAAFSASLIVALLGCASFVLAGPNAGGTIILHDPNYIWCLDRDGYCGLGTPPASCTEADVRLDGTFPGASKLFKMYAAFPEGSRPRLKAMSFGVHYPTPAITLVAWGPCIGDLNNGALEFPGPGWPEPDTGTAMVFQNTQTSLLVECYWFAGYNYYPPVPQILQLRDHPDPVLGGNFTGDGVVADPDPIAGYGSLGFDTDGVVACPSGEMGACCLCDGSCTQTLESECPTGHWMPSISCDPNPCSWPLGACCLSDGHCVVEIECRCNDLGGAWLGQQPCVPNPCVPTGACCNLDTRECRIMTEEECGQQSFPHRYLGDHTVCDPNPCPEPVPVRESSWGWIKALYR
jgi:hypothetical protein